MNKNYFKSREYGFTLIELLIAMAITGVVSAAIFTAFLSQQKSYLIQEDTAAMQQNLRAGMYMMVREIRMAGYDPTIDANAGIVSATSNSINFTMDVGNGVDDDSDGIIDETDEFMTDGDTNDPTENITYSLYTTDNIKKLGRKNPSLNRPVSENIDALEFYYTLADGTKTLTPLDTALIRSVRITMLARSEREDRKFVNTQPYPTPGGQAWGPYNDNFRRRFLTTTVKCRNMGL